MKRKAYPILLALLLAFQLTGCGGGDGYAGGTSTNGSSTSSESADRDMGEYSEDMPAEREDGIDSGAGEIDGSIYDGSKLILRGSIQAEATDFDRALSAIEQQVAAAGGYIESSSTRGSTGARWAELTIRVPREQFNSTFDAVGENCHVTESSRSSENVSESYYDSETRKAALEIKRDRLLALLEKAEKMEDIILLEDALSEVQYQIEALSGTLRNYDRLIAFSTLNVYLSEVRDLTVVQKENTFLDDLHSAAVQGTRGLVTVVEGLILTVVYAWWFFALLLLTLLVFLRRRRKRRSGREEFERRMRSPVPPLMTLDRAEHPEPVQQSEPPEDPK